MQQTKSSPDRGGCNYHFFNTYFYNKLKEAMLNKQNDKESSFVKLRRWWKGVNLFEKAYLFLPIHESLHWILVIICIPDKEDESGPIVLQLDSLMFHCSKPIFNNTKRFLIEEWKILKDEGPHFPIAR
nr:ubiquitin-like-specific protease 1D isoform X1 [Ipomoea batatas]